MMDADALARLTDDDIAFLREDHGSTTLYSGSDNLHHCRGCGDLPPCGVTRLLAAYDALLAERDGLAAVVAAAREIDTCAVCQGHGVVYRAVDDGDVAGEECDCRIALQEALAAVAARGRAGDGG